MTKKKTSAAPARAAGNAPQPSAILSNPQQRGGSGIEDAIAKAKQGKVNLPITEAVDMAATLFSQGRLDQAEQVCRQVIAARPANADAHNVLGVTLNAGGKPKDAVAMLRRAAELAPHAATIHANLAEVLRQQGELDEAAKAAERAIELEPNHAQALNTLGITYFERGKPKIAAEHYRGAIEARPSMAEAHNNLGNALRMMGDIEGAIHAYQEALVHREQYPEAYKNLGTLLQQRGDLEQAEHALRKALLQNPKYVEAYDNLANVHVAQKNDVEALRVLGEALKIAPTHVPTLLITARIQARRNAHALVEQAARLALKQEPDNVEALTVLGQVLHETDRYDEALEVLEKALEANPENPEALNFYGIALKSVGRLEEARETILKALRLNKNVLGGYANLSDLVDFSKDEGDELFQKMDEIFKNARNPEADAFLPLHFAYAKALDDRGEHERALEHYVIGGRMKRAQLNYDEAETHAFFDSIRATFPKEVFENRTFEGLPDERPVFIVGMPRSGSTLVEQILSSHPDVYGAGEVKYLSVALGKLRDRFPSLPKYPEMVKKITPAQMGIVAENYLQALTANAGDATRVTDKLLTNYFFAGLLNLLYPKARIINTQRDPVDTCLSGFTKLFKDDMPHSYDLGELGRYYGKYRELMQHWNEVLPEGALITVQYEDVVADTEGQARRLIEFLGLPWNDKCIDFHKSDRPVKTASVAQVRKPIYKTSVKRWKKYGDGLQPLVDAIEGKSDKDAKAKAKPKAKAKENA